MDINFQYAHHEHDESETKPNVSESEAIDAFDLFDWFGEVEKANKYQKCSPTLSIIIEEPENMIWVSGYGEGGNIEFVSECRFPGEVSSWFGFSKKQGTVSLHSGSLSKAEAKAALEYFIQKKHDLLRELYA